MSALSNNPTSLNFLSPLNFNFRLKRPPNLNFFIQKVNLPGISFPSPNETNPFVNIPVAGDHLRNAYPTSLTALSFQTTDTTVEFISATATFKYIMYDIVKI